MSSAPTNGASAQLLMSCESQKYMNEKDEMLNCRAGAELGFKYKRAMNKMK
jgi:hypothetical protein